MSESIFKCPKCGKEFKRDCHYLKIVEYRNYIITRFSNIEIKDICMSCNHIESENKEQ